MNDRAAHYSLVKSAKVSTQSSIPEFPPGNALCKHSVIQVAARAARYLGRRALCTVAQTLEKINPATATRGQLVYKGKNRQEIKLMAFSTRTLLTIWHFSP